MVWTMFLKMHVYVNVFFPLTGITTTVKVLLPSKVRVIDMNVCLVFMALTIKQSTLNQI